MRHDKKKFGCKEGKYLMSPVMASGATEWSKCSQQELVKFLNDK